MCIHISHLVLEALRDTNDQVVDECSDGSESSDILSGTVVQFDVDYILLGVREVDCQMAEVLRELACSFVRLPSLYLSSRDLQIPRGPSTVTSRDLIVTLTIRPQYISNCSPSNALVRESFNFIQFYSNHFQRLRRENCAHHPRGRSRSH